MRHRHSGQLHRPAEIWVADGKARHRSARPHCHASRHRPTLCYLDQRMEPEVAGGERIRVRCGHRVCRVTRHVRAFTIGAQSPCMTESEFPWPPWPLAFPHCSRWKLCNVRRPVCPQPQQLQDSDFALIPIHFPVASWCSMATNRPARRSPTCARRRAAGREH